MRKNLWYKFLLVISTATWLIDCQAQSSFQYKSALDEIKYAGFHKIILPPVVVAKSKNELQDVRILNNKGSQVPYVLKSDKPQFRNNNFIEFPILAVRKEADKQTHIIIQNTTNKTIGEVMMVIKNTDAERTITLSGSDDQRQWFVIKERIPLISQFIREQDHFIQSLKFPNSSYKFFQLVINGKDLLPVNIVKIGVYNDVLYNGEYLGIPEPAIIQKDSSDKRSYVRLLFSESYQVDKLTLNVQGPRFFRRHLMIREGGSNASDDYLLSSAVDSSYTVNLKARDIMLIIENQDNPPLRVQSVKAYQSNKYLLAYLGPTDKYSLLFGDSTTTAPEYDLEFFKDSLDNKALNVSLGPIIEIVAAKSPLKKTGNNMLILWIIIILVLAILLILTFRMTKEVAGKDSKP